MTLKFLEQEGRLPEFVEEIPSAAIEYVADLVKVPAAEFAKCAFTGRTAEYHRKQIREALGFRPCTRADEEGLISWLAAEVRPVKLAEALLLQGP
ncbi:DUF4158 domain-containing protein [Streptomyces sp. NPDC088748]|uniref:DUF4158 domain-containing protein n=1 Tax=Streptomyces sp. NPDC088748 TaxID=3365887 RepID=UPI003800518E